MRAGPVGFQKAHQANATPFVEAIITVNGDQVLSTIDPNPDRRFSIIGNPIITYDLSRKIVTTVTEFTIAIPDDFVPQNTSDALSPMNNVEFTISTGYIWNGKPVTVPIAKLLLWNINLINQGQGREVKVQLVDRAKLLQIAQLWTPRSIPSGANRLELANELIARVIPDITINAPNISTPLPAMEIEEGTTVLDLLVDKIFRPVNHAFYFDTTGLAQVVGPTPPDAEPVAELETILEVNRNLGLDDFYNGYVLRAESPRETDADGDAAEPLYAEAWADDAINPRLYTQSMADAGAPGAFPRVETTQNLTTQQDVNRATAEAATILSLLPEHVTATVAYDPRLEPGDAVGMQDPTTGTSGVFAIARMERAVSPAPMALTMAERRSGNRVHHSTSGAAGHLARLGITEQRDQDNIITRIGTVTSIDYDGRPPIITLDGTRRMRFLDLSGTIEIGDRVLWIPNDTAPVALRKLRATPDAPTTPAMPNDYVYTGDASAGYPAVAFRFYQGNADSQGKASFDIGIAAADVLVAHATSPQYSTMSRQWSRPVKVTANGTAQIEGMVAGRPFKLFILEKNDSPPGTTPTYRYLASGNNTVNNPEGDHPAFAIKAVTGTAPTSGSTIRAAGGTGVDFNDWLAGHVRAIDANGDSIDVSSLFSAHNDGHSNSLTPRVHTDGTITGRGFEGLDYTLTIFHHGDNAYDTDPNLDLVSDYLGKDAIGNQAQFQVVSYANNTVGGRAEIPTGFDDIEFRSVAAFGMINRYVASAEMYSEGANVWRVVDRVRHLYLNNHLAYGFSFVLKGGDTAEQVT